jgi:putative ABC transport system permease protein
MEKTLSQYYPCDMQVTMDTAADQAAVETRNRELAADAGVSVSDFHAFTGYEVLFTLNGEQLVDADTMSLTGLNDYSRMHLALLLTGEAYAQLEGAPLPLAANEIGYWTTAKSMPDTLEIGANRYALRKIDSLAVTPCLSGGSAVNTTYLVLPDQAAVRAILTQAGETETAPVYTSQWNVQGSAAGLKAYYAAAGDASTGWAGHSLRVKASLREEWYAMHGGLLFVGIFLGLIFLMGTAMILYFKQVSEGYQDHDRFIIMQQVGMSPEEVKGTVRSQILMVFFLPLLVAVCHVGGSLHMIALMLRLFGLTDTPYIALNTFLAAAGVMALYGLFYIKTAGTYYRLVKF